MFRLLLSFAARSSPRPLTFDPFSTSSAAAAGHWNQAIRHHIHHEACDYRHQNGHNQQFNSEDAIIGEARNAATPVSTLRFGPLLLVED